VSDDFTLILKGSPSPTSGSLALARIMAGILGGKARVVDLYGDQVMPCRGCLLCASGVDCPLNDSMPEYLLLLAAADYVIVASPLHFSSLTAPVIAFFSRLQPCWQAGRQGREALPPRRRRGALAVTGGGEYPNMFRPARSVAAAAFNSLGIPFAGMVGVANTDIVPAAENAGALEEVGELAKRMREG
jgi:multimeric flavodoxin WrbA